MWLLFFVTRKIFSLEFELLFIQEKITCFSVLFRIKCKAQEEIYNMDAPINEYDEYELEIQPEIKRGYNL